MSMKKENRYGERLARAGSHGWDTLRKRIRMLLPELSTDSGGVKRAHHSTGLSGSTLRRQLVTTGFPSSRTVFQSTVPSVYHSQGQSCLNSPLQAWSPGQQPSHMPRTVMLTRAEDLQSGRATEALVAPPPMWAGL